MFGIVVLVGTLLIWICTIRSKLDFSSSDQQELERNTNQPELNTIATYYFDGQGKALRPMVAILMARAVNYHVYGENR